MKCSQTDEIPRYACCKKVLHSRYSSRKTALDSVFAEQIERLICSKPHSLRFKNWTLQQKWSAFFYMEGKCNYQYGPIEQQAMRIKQNHWQQ